MLVVWRERSRLVVRWSDLYLYIYLANAVHNEFYRIFNTSHEQSHTAKKPYQFSSKVMATLCYLYIYTNKCKNAMMPLKIDITFPICKETTHVA